MSPSEGVTEGRPVAKPRRLDAPAYVLRLLEDGRWMIVATAAGKTLRLNARREPVISDAVLPGAEPVAAMQREATVRTAYVMRLLVEAGKDPDDHVVVFLGCSAAEASQLTGIPLAGRKRAT